MRKKLRRSGVWIALAASVIIGGGAGVAYATGAIATGSDDVIVGCAKNANGQLRIVDNASQCLPTEHTVAFQAPLPPSGPQFVTVDCAAGQSINQALQQSARTQPLSITIKGTCTEAVRVARDDVTLRAFSSGDGIQAPSGAFSALVLDDARRINLDQLTLTGGQSGLSVFRESSLVAHGLRVMGASNTGISVSLGSSAQLNNPTVENAGFEGIQAHNGGSVSLHGGTISDSGTFGVSAQGGGSVFMGGGTVVSGTGFIGVFASFSGSIDIFSATVEESGGPGAMANQGGSIHFNGSGGILIQNNGQQGVAVNNGGAASVSNGTRVIGNSNGGIIVFSSGALQLESSFVENNSGDGVTLAIGSSAQIERSTISGNSGSGIHVSDTSMVQFGFPSGNNEITSNGGWGVICDPAPSVADIRGGVGTVSGNGAGQVSCPSG